MENAVTESTRKARVLIVEDHPIVAQGLAMLINDEPDLVVVGHADSLKTASAQVQATSPDVVVVDISVGDGNGLDLIREIHERDANLPMLALSMHDESVYAERALRAGAKGYVMKKEAMDKVMMAIRRVLTGEIYLSDTMSSRMVSKLINPQKGAAGSPVESLSNREFEIFRLIAQSIGPTEIARRLNVSVKTVETHREHIKEKLNLASAAELTRFALDWCRQYG